MNEQIQQLALRAGFNLHNDLMDGHSFHHEIEKFAELIVRECAQDFDNTYMSGGKTMGAYIREKFGVEE